MVEASCDVKPLVCADDSSSCPKMGRSWLVGPDLFSGYDYLEWNCEVGEGGG